MKKNYTFFASILAIFSLNAQSFSDDFEGYTVGDYLAQKSSTWATWSGPNGGGTDDNKIVNTKAKSGSKSVYFSSTQANGGPSDIVLPFGGQYNTGSLNLQMSLFVDSGKSAYFNFQEQTTMGNGYALDVYFQPNGSFEVNNSTAGNLITSNYQQKKWITLTVDINLNTNTWVFKIDGIEVGNFENFTRQIAAIDIYPINGSSFWLDDVSFNYLGNPTQTKNASITYIDNLFGYLAGSSRIPKIEFRNLGSSAVTSIEVKTSYNGITDSKILSGLNVAKGAYYNLSMDNPITIVGGMHEFKATIVNVNGGSDEDSTDNKKSINLNPIIPAKDKLVIAEEATGTWCQWCPRGAVALRDFHSKYEGFFQGIAIHNSDPMTNFDYDASAAGRISGFPSAFVDRGTTMDPSAIGADVLKRLQTAPKATFSFAAKYDASTKILKVAATTTMKEAISGNYKIACVIVEDSVHGTTSSYNQANVYSGGNKGVMGGFEKLANPVPASKMYYDHVARGIAPTFNGLPNAYGSSASAGQTFTHNFTFKIDSTWNRSKMKIVGMFIDAADLIDNGGVIDLNNALNNNYQQGTEVAGSVDLNLYSNIKIFPNPTKNVFTLTSKVKPNLLKVLDLNGKLILEIPNPTASQTIDMSNQANGMYLVNVVFEDQNFTYKILKQ